MRFFWNVFGNPFFIICVRVLVLGDVRQCVCRSGKIVTCLCVSLGVCAFRMPHSCVCLGVCLSTVHATFEPITVVIHVRSAMCACVLVVLT